MFKPKNINVATEAQVNQKMIELKNEDRFVKSKIYRVLKKHFSEKTIEDLVEITEEIFYVTKN